MFLKGSTPVMKVTVSWDAELPESIAKKFEEKKSVH